MQKDFVQYFFLNCGYNWVIFCAIRFTALHIFCPTWMFLERYFRKESIWFAKLYINYKMLVDFSIQERICSISTWAHLRGSEASFFVKTCSISVAGSWNPTWWSFRSGSSSICVQRTMASFTITITITKITTLMTGLRQTLWHFFAISIIAHHYDQHQQHHQHQQFQSQPIPQNHQHISTLKTPPWRSGLSSEWCNNNHLWRLRKAREVPKAQLHSQLWV